MPNWCSNSFEIVGPREKIRALWTEATRQAEEGSKKEYGLLGALRPEPNYEEVDVEPAFPNIRGNNDPVDKSQSWWDWRVSNWGTKWEVDCEGMQFEEDEDGNFENEDGKPYARITGWFDSAWSPPVNAFQFYSEQNPDVRMTLDYYESGMGFVGRAQFADGEQTCDEYYDIGGYTSKDVRDLIGDELDDLWGISENMAEWEAMEEEDSREEVQSWYEDGVEKKGLEPHGN